MSDLEKTSPSGDEVANEVADLVPGPRDARSDRRGWLVIGGITLACLTISAIVVFSLGGQDERPYEGNIVATVLRSQLVSDEGKRVDDVACPNRTFAKNQRITCQVTFEGGRLSELDVRASGPVDDVRVDVTRRDPVQEDTATRR